MKEETKTLVFSPDTFVKMLEFLEKSFGSAGRSIMFQMGFVGGSYESRKILNVAGGGGDKTKREVMDVVLDGLKSTGLVMKIVEFNTEKGVVKVVFHNSVFEPICLKTELPQCLWLRGFLTGVISEVTGMKLSFKESECYANGDPDCSIRLVREQQQPIRGSAELIRDVA